MAGGEWAGQGLEGQAKKLDMRVDRTQSRGFGHSPFSQSPALVSWSAFEARPEMGALGAHLGVTSLSPRPHRSKGLRRRPEQGGTCVAEAQRPGIFSQLLSCWLEGFLNKGLRVLGAGGAQLWNLPSSAVDSLCGLTPGLSLHLCNMGPVQVLWREASEAPTVLSTVRAPSAGPKTSHGRHWQPLSLALGFFHLL